MSRQRWAVTASAALAAVLVAGALAWLLAPSPVRTATPPLTAYKTPAHKTTPERPQPSPATMTVVALPPPPATPVALLPAPAPRPIPVPRKALTPLPPQPQAAPSTVAVRPLRAEKSKPPAPLKTSAETPPAPSPARSPAVVANPAETAADGRVLLRLLEHGSGPGIEIRWPREAAERERLYHVLKRCYGMRLALLDSQSRLFVEGGARGDAWRPNLDRFSGFVRQPLGPLTGGERRQAAAIRARHGALGAAVPVRLFPRPVDAALLGGLRNLIGDGYGDRRTIRARYRLTGGAVIIEGVTVNGRSVAGRVDLSRVARCARRL